MLLVAPWWVEGPPPGRGRRLLALHAAVALVLSPWLVRNARLYGVPLFSTMTPEYLFLGNVPPSMGSNLLPSGVPVIDAAPAELRNRIFAADERGQGEVFATAVRDFLTAHPFAFAGGVARKLLYFWTWAPQTGRLYPPAYRSLYLLFYVPALGLAALGALRLRRLAPGHRVPAVLVALLASVSLVHALLYVEQRHRWMLEPWLAVLAGIGAFGAGATSPTEGESRGRHSDGTARRSGGGGPR
jgi:hypothetical protein